MPFSIKRLFLLLLTLGPLRAYLKQDLDLTGLSGEHSHHQCVFIQRRFEFACGCKNDTSGNSKLNFGSRSR
jgi:hypothetical protein